MFWGLSGRSPDETAENTGRVERIRKGSENEEKNFGDPGFGIAIFNIRQALSPARHTPR